MVSVSIIIPVLNEEYYIESFIESLFKQTYDSNKLEYLFIDGNSIDATVNLINDKFKNTDLNYKVIINERKITPISLNLGIENAVGDLIIRLDAHSEYPENYIEKCVFYINNIPDADNVGCTIQTISKGLIGESIASVLSSKFGVGNSQFRTGGEAGFVDTVPFGTFRSELFKKIGYFDERLERNQDSEFNHRIIKNGGKIYLFTDINIKYHPRNTISKLVKMAYSNGKWNIFTTYLVPGSMKIRHFIPLIFVISILFGILCIVLNNKLFTRLFICEMILYFILDLYFSLKSENLYKGFFKLIIFPLFHISYGMGSIMGFIKILKERKAKYEEN